MNPRLGARGVLKSEPLLSWISLSAPLPPPPMLAPGFCSHWLTPGPQPSLSLAPPEFCSVSVTLEALLPRPHSCLCTLTPSGHHPSIGAPSCPSGLAKHCQINGCLFLRIFLLVWLGLPTPCSSLSQGRQALGFIPLLIWCLSSLLNVLEPSTRLVASGPSSS